MASLLQKLLLIIQLLFVSLVVATNNSSIILPAGGCSDVCGSVHIPYPFGTKSGCSYDDSFLITCNNSLNPPRPFLPQTHIPIINILLESGELRVDAAGFVSSECSEKQGQQRIAKYNKTASFKTSNSSTFPLSTRNKFTTLGCRTVGVIAGEKGKPYHTGCVALCEKAEDLNNMSCSGRGCCQMNIPRRVIDYNIVVAHFVTVEVEDKLILEFDPCGYAFVVEEAAYEFMVSDLKSMERKTFPV
ncbi:hypothetical protein TIFTF001_005871 [Ficus carica]|uniref:Wall-associated receptor kinase galacturonan-binding domain-containing protein n=1 Tax=Ficus carica TaxID=3494 RepID=A0AA88CZY3_FICCA|nr:hypothetical protein TIFTF001_005871 [Ficus carica]